MATLTPTQGAAQPTTSIWTCLTMSSMYTEIEMKAAAATTTVLVSSFGIVPSLSAAPRSESPDPTAASASRLDGAPERAAPSEAMCRTSCIM